MTPLDRVKIQDCLHLVQSAQGILEEIPTELIPELSEVTDCFVTANEKLRQALAA